MTTAKFATLIIRKNWYCEKFKPAHRDYRPELCILIHKALEMKFIRISKAMLHVICPPAQLLIIDISKEAFGKAF